MESTAELRRKWLEAARKYYITYEDSGMSDPEWDYIGRLLYKDRDKFPSCPILNDPDYLGGSLFWVDDELYAKALNE